MSSVKKNYFYNVMYQLLVAIIPIVTAPYLARTVGRTGSGTFSYYSTVASYFVLFTQLGVVNYGTRAISVARNDMEKKSRTFSSIVILTVSTCAISLIIFFIYGILQIGVERRICLILLLQIIAAGIDISWLYFGLEEFKITAMRNMVVKIFTTILIFIFVKNAEDLWVYTLIIAGSSLVSSLVLWGGLRSRAKLCWVSKKELLLVLKSCLILFVPAIATSVYKNMDKIILGQMVDMDAVGLYTYAEKIPNLLLGFIGALGTVMLPQMSQLFAQEKLAEAQTSLKKAMTFVMFVASAMGFGLAGIALEFTPIFYGDAFYNSGILTIPVAITMLFASWGAIIRNLYILPTGRDKLVIATVSAGAVINLIIDLSLIPLIGTMGAVVGLFCAELVIPVVQWIALRNSIPYRKLVMLALPYILSGLVMFMMTRIIGALLGKHLYTVAIQIIVGAVVYLGGVFGVARFKWKESYYFLMDGVGMVRKRK